jgi:hypothetical protein
MFGNARNLDLDPLGGLLVSDVSHRQLRNRLARRLPLGLLRPGAALSTLSLSFWRENLPLTISFGLSFIRQ